MQVIVLYFLLETLLQKRYRILSYDYVNVVAENFSWNILLLKNCSCSFNVHNIFL